MHLFRVLLISHLLFVYSSLSLGAQTDEAEEFILDKFQTYTLVAMGEAHGLIEQHTFLKSLISGVRFREVGNIVVEFGNALFQQDIDQFVMNEVDDDSKVKECLNNTTQALNLSWQEPIYLDFFYFVREINSGLPREQKIRILLGDPPIDWNRVSADDYQRYLLNRDSHFFSVVESEILTKKKKALIITGVGHLLRDKPGNLGALLQAKSTKTYVIHPLLDVGSLGRLLKADLELRQPPSIIELKNAPWSLLPARHGLGIVKIKVDINEKVSPKENQNKKIITKPLTGGEKLNDHGEEKQERMKYAIADALIHLGDKPSYQTVPKEKINLEYLNDVNEKCHRVNQPKLADDLQKLRQLLRKHH